MVIAFQGIEGWKNTVQLRLYDADNHVLTNGDAVKISLRSGVFRADVLLGDAVVWREYFRVRD
jgi:hypothetical protein